MNHIGNIILDFVQDAIHSEVLSRIQNKSKNARNTASCIWLTDIIIINIIAEIVPKIIWFEDFLKKKKPIHSQYNKIDVNDGA